MNDSPAHDVGGTLPFFSVALPAYDAEDTLAAAIESIQAQSFSEWELIVVDDGSTDATRTIAEKFAASDPRISLVVQPNAGCGAARNTAIEHARAAWIVRFDADDLLGPEFLQRIRDEIKAHPEVEIVSPTGLRSYRDGHDEVWCPDARYREARELTLEDALHGWCPVFTHSVFRRSLWERIGGIRADAYAEDYDFWVRALAAGAKAWFFPEPLSVYGCGDEGQMSARSNRIANSYLDSLERVASGGQLSASDLAAVRRRIGQLRRRVAFRATTRRLLGEKNSEKLAGAIVSAVNRLRG